MTARGGLPTTDGLGTNASEHRGFFNSHSLHYMSPFHLSVPLHGCKDGQIRSEMVNIEIQRIFVSWDWILLDSETVEETSSF